MLIGQGQRCAESEKHCILCNQLHRNGLLLNLLDYTTAWRNTSLGFRFINICLCDCAEGGNGQHVRQQIVDLLQCQR